MKEITEEGISGWFGRQKYLLGMESCSTHNKDGNGFTKHYRVTIDLFESKEDALKVYPSSFYGRVKVVNKKCA